MPAIQVAADAALIIVDIQNSFLPGGSLAVPNGSEIIPLVNQLSRKFSQIVVTQDWHPANHLSFASQHPNTQPFDTIDVAYGKQTLWPDHCIQGSHGAAFARELDVDRARLILRKGTNPLIDSYSAFLEADRTTTTGLAAWLQSQAIDTIWIVGLATDFCVVCTAIDAVAAGFNCYIIEDACRGIDTNGSLAVAWQAMQQAGVRIAHSQAILGSSK